MNNINQQPPQEDIGSKGPPINRFMGKKIENTITFNIAQQIRQQPNEFEPLQNNPIQISSNKGQAIPLSFAIPQKKSSTKLTSNPSIPNASSVDKSKLKSKNTITNSGNIMNQQQISQQNLQNLIQEQARQKKFEQQDRNDENYKNQIPQSLQERRQQKKLEQMQTEHALVKKDISIIQQATNMSNLSSDCEEFVDIMVPKKNQLNHLQVQNYLNQQNSQNNIQSNNAQQNQEREQRKQADIDDMIRKSNLKYKTDKEIMELQKQQKQQETQQLKEKLKKQEEEIRKRNQQKTQQFKEKKKRKEKESQIQKQEQEQQKRGKSISKSNKQQQNQQQSRQNMSQQDTSRDNINNQKPDITKEQFDQATKNRVKEMMRKQKEEKERQEEEKEKKKLKLEILRQEQLIQLQKAKVKTIEQGEEERKAQIVKRPGGGCIPQQFQDRRDSRQLQKQSVDQYNSIQDEDNYNYQNNQEYYSNEDYQIQQYQQQQQNFMQQQQQYQQYQQQQPKSQRDRSLKSKKAPSQQKIISATKNRPQSSAGIKKTNQNDIGVSDSFLKENIHASIKQLYPNCSLEELIQLEQEYRKEFKIESQKQQKLNNFKQKPNKLLNRPKSAYSKKESTTINDFEKLKRKQLTENKAEFQKLLDLKKLDDFDINSVKNPIEMIENLKNLASQIEDDIDQNDRKFGIGKYKHKSKQNLQPAQTKSSSQEVDKHHQMKQEIAKLEKEAYLKQVYLNAQNTFSPEEMQEFEKYLESHIVNGEIQLTDDENDNSMDSDEEDQDQNEEDDDEEEEDEEDEDEEDEEDEEDCSNGQDGDNNNSYNHKIQFQQNTQPKTYIQNSKTTKPSNHPIPPNKKIQPKGQPKNSQNLQYRSIIHHSKSVQDMSENQNSAKRGRSQDQRAPKSCLIKESKSKRSKTVTFDKSYVKSDQKNHLQTSPSIHQQKEKYDFNEFDDFNERDPEESAMLVGELQNEKEKRRQIQENAQINFIDQKQKEMLEIIKKEQEKRMKFEKKVQEVKELSAQYSGDKKQSIDITNPIMSSLECSSASSNLRLSHLKSQNVPFEIKSSETPNQQSINSYTNFVNKQQANKLSNEKAIQQNKSNISQEIPNSKIKVNNQSSNLQNNGINYPPKTANNISKQSMPQSNQGRNSNISQENVNSQNIPFKLPQNDIKKQKQNDDFKPSPIQITQSSPQALSNIPTEFEADFLNFNEQFDLDKFQSQITQDDLKQLIHVNNLDLKSFFTNEKLNSVHLGKNQGQAFQNQNYMDNNGYNNNDDESDEDGLFADDSPRSNQNQKQNKNNKGKEITQSQEAINYYEKNKGQFQSNEKKFNNYMNQQDIDSSYNKKEDVNDNEFQQSYLEFNKQFLDDDKLFALSATDLLKLAETNTRLQK